MAIAAARRVAVKAPTKSRPRQSVTDRTAEIISGIFPETNSDTRASHKYFATFATVISALGFVSLLAINTLLAQDAFTISELKLEAKQVADQRDAINRAIDSYAAPERLAAAAASLGMRPSETPIFLNLATLPGVTNG
jgi:hypothetical protein